MLVFYFMHHSVHFDFLQVSVAAISRVVFPATGDSDWVQPWLIPQAPVQHVPGKDEPDECHACQGDQRFRQLAPQASVLLSP